MNVALRVIYCFPCGDVDIRMQKYEFCEFKLDYAQVLKTMFLIIFYLKFTFQTTDDNFTSPGIRYAVPSS